MLRREAAQAVRGLRRGDWAWLGLGGGVLLLYGVADVAVALAAHAAALRAWWLWVLALPAMCGSAGMLVGTSIASLAASRAHARFLDALPISRAGRHRAAALASTVLAAPIVALTGAMGAGARLAIAGSAPAAWAGAAACYCAVGTGLGAAWTLRGAFRTRERNGRTEPRRSLPAGWLGRLDAWMPSWIGAWAWSCQGGRLPVGGWTFAGAGLAFASAVPIGASLVRRDAVPASLAAVVAGLSVFILSLRCHTLRSPVLRTAPVGFARAWLRHLRLPAALSCAFFLLPAGVALAAEPAAWRQPVGGGFWLLALDLCYAIFAVYFAGAPVRAALGFVAVLGYADYESLEYGRTVLLALAGLFAWMWLRARRRFYRG